MPSKLGVSQGSAGDKAVVDLSRMTTSWIADLLVLLTIAVWIDYEDCEAAPGRKVGISRLSWSVYLFMRRQSCEMRWKL